MKNLKRWIAIILAVVIVVGASTVFVDHKLKASETNGDTTAQQQQEVAEEAGKEVEVVVPPIAESEPVVIPEEPAEEPVEEIPAEPAEEPVEEIPAEPAEEPVEEIPSEPAEEPEEEIPEEPTEEDAEEVWEDIVIRSASIKVPSYIYSAGETASAELVLKIENADGVNLNKFVIELTKVNSAETTVSDLVSGMTALEGKLMNGEIAFEYKFDFVPFDGENETASLKAVIKDTDEEETVLAVAEVTFEKQTEEIINEPAEDIEETTEEEPAEEIAEEPVEEPAEEIVEEPTEEPEVEEITEEPTEEPEVEEITEEPTEEPEVEEITEEPTEEPEVEEITEEPTEEPEVEEITEEPTEEPEVEEIPAEPVFGFEFDQDPATLGDGDELTMRAVITGLDGIEYEVIWQQLVGEEWIDVATGAEFTIVVGDETRGVSYRYIVMSV